MRRTTVIATVLLVAVGLTSALVAGQEAHKPAMQYPSSEEECQAHYSNGERQLYLTGCPQRVVDLRLDRTLVLPAVAGLTGYKIKASADPVAFGSLSILGGEEARSVQWIGLTRTDVDLDHDLQSVTWYVDSCDREITLHFTGRRSADIPENGVHVVVDAYVLDVPERWPPTQTCGGIPIELP